MNVITKGTNLFSQAIDVFCDKLIHRDHVPVTGTTAFCVTTTYANNAPM